MIGRCTLNNLNMRNIRKDHVYQAVIIDLTNLGVISKEEAAELGVPVPDHITLPSGRKAAVSEDEIKESKFVETEETTEEEVAEDTIEEEVAEDEE